jgi:cytochrome c556
MKIRILSLTTFLMVVAGLAGTFAQSKRNRAAKEFMRDKLELSQRVLEGLATEDYDLIIAKGTRLSAMSKEVDWRVFENPDYDQQSATFRRQVDSLVKAAKDKNLDAATLAYVRMTMSCVDCHKLVRGKLVASTGGLSAWDTGGVSKRWIECEGRPARNGEQPPSTEQRDRQRAAIF